MTDSLPDTLRRLSTDPGEYIDSDDPLAPKQERSHSIVVVRVS